MSFGRLTDAAVDPRVVVHASGLLAVFNDAGVLAPVDVAAAATVVRLCGETSDEVALAAALAVRGTRFGHVCIRLDRIRQAVVVDGHDPDEIEALPWPEPEGWLEAVAASALVGEGADRPLVVDGGRLYLERYHRYERQVAAMLADRSDRPMREVEASALELVEHLVGSSPEDPDRRQVEAARLGLTSDLAVIAGGPGTGKTHTIGAVLAGLLTADPPPVIGLCAPTGKASARLGEALETVAERIDHAPTAEALRAVPASTIHRLLGWTFDRARFRHHAANPLPHDVVVVDEMSMVSLPLAAKLLSAVRDDARVVLVGDPFQLESIEAGTVLADIVGPAERVGDGAPIAGRVVVLDRGHRFEERGPIAELAEAVRTAAPDRALELLGSGDPRLRWVPDRGAPGFAELWEVVMAHRTGLVQLAGTPDADEDALEALDRLAVLCARRHGPDSVARWRRDIEAELDLRFTGLRYGGEWYPGRPVMITSNDYDLKLYNGDIGVTTAGPDGRLRVVFDQRGPAEFAPTHLGEHTTAHAMTIHKAQGSQFDEVVVVLPDDGSRLLTRELLYTAVTRARHRVWVLGTDTVIRRAITRSVERASGLSTLLWESRT